MASPQYWKTSVRPIVDGESVNAQVANRAIQDQTSREEFLYGQIQNLNLTSGRVVKAEVAIHSSAALYDIVYFDTVSESWAPALAEYTEVDGEPVPTDRSFATGMILSLSAGFGDVLLFGQILVSGTLMDYAIDFLELLDTAEFSLTPGAYYLSRKIAGKISRVPAAPTVHIGNFNSTNFFFNPNHKSFQESHFHYAFDLDSIPSASQNYDETGWFQFVAGGTKFVDYFNRNTNTSPPLIIATIRWTGAVVPTDCRVEIYRSSAGKFSAVVISDGIDYNNPQSAGVYNDTVITDQLWPQYGEYISIGTTGLEVAFLRNDGVYGSGTSLSADAESLIPNATDKFKFFLPNDLHGWTNVNTLDINSPVGAVYRYIIEGQKLLDMAFPPLPLSSAIIESNGISLQRGEDFIISLAGIWWIPSDDYAPWPSDYRADGVGMVDNNARFLKIHFSRATTSNVAAGVQSLRSNTPALVIAKCPTGEPAEDGPLSIDLNLSLQVDTDVTESKDLALVGVDGLTFLTGPIVTELVAGSGIALERLSSSLIPNSSRFTGKVRVSRMDVNLEGEISSIALRNAKEEKGSFFPYVSFPSPSRTASGITASFKIPITGVTMGGLTVSTQVLGSVSAAADRTAIFKAVYHAVRPGFNVGTFVEGNAFAVQYWTVLLATGYSALNVLSNEVQGDEITATTIAADYPSSLVAIDTGATLKDGDIIAVTITRVTNDGGSGTDNYAGDIGFAGLRWVIA